MICITDDKHYESIADAIRAKNGKTDTYKPAAMAAAILAIESGGEGGGGGKKISEVNIYDSIDTYLIMFDDGSMVTGSATFGEDGLPTSLTDDGGSYVTFSSGYPISATDSEGNAVPIIWG
jgi:hypothetical protein